MRRPFALFTLAILLSISGCGYTTRSLLPTEFKQIYVENFKNEIKITDEQNNLRMYVGYRPGMEIDLTNEVINQYLLDGNLKISTESNSDLTLKASLNGHKSKNSLAFCRHTGQSR